MKKVIISIVLTITSISMWGQDVYVPILQQIEQNNTTLQALQQQMEADKLQNRTNLMPDDPEVEFGYLWGHPAIIGERKEVKVSQSFDFPTVYAKRNKLSDEQNQSVEYRYRVERMQLLFDAKNKCIELVYFNMLYDMYARQLDNAKNIVDTYDKMLKRGEANRIEYNKANLNYATLKNQLELIDIERKRLKSELESLSGGKTIELNLSILPVPVLPADFEQWYAVAEANNPSLQYLRSKVEVANQQIDISQTEGLPKLSIGYMGEFVGGEQFQGISIGVSIPLWKNKNRVKQAKASALASQLKEDDCRVIYYNNLKGLYKQAISLRESITLYSSSLSENGNDALLLKAFEKGELSLLEYLLEMEFFYDCFEKRAEAERDLALVLAELTAYEL